MQVDVWSDVVCPFCYLGKQRLQRVAAAYGYELQWVWHSFQLDATAPARYTVSNVERLAQKYGMSVAQSRAQMERIAVLFEREGIHYAWETCQPGNTRDAHRVLQVAQERGLGTQATEAFFTAYFERGEAIGERSVVQQIARDCGLDDAAIHDALASTAIDARIDADIEAAGEMNVSGVPFFVFANKFAVSGAQPDEVFLQALQSAAPPRLEPVGGAGMACEGDNCAIPE